MLSAGRSCDMPKPSILEKVQTTHKTVLANCFAIVARNDLLFTMSEITQAYPSRTSLANKMLRGLFDCAFVDQLSSIGLSSFFPSPSIWWRQTGSNRRPHACKARALPAELCPRTRRRMLLMAWSMRSQESTLGKWWAWEDLNFRPHAYQARALTN